MGAILLVVAYWVWLLLPNVFRPVFQAIIASFVGPNVSPLEGLVGAPVILGP